MLGSVTPEGKILFNTLSNGDLKSLYGDITGDATAAQMILAEYNSLGVYTGGVAYIYLVPPFSETLDALHNRAGRGAAEVLYRVFTTQSEWSSNLMTAVDTLGGLSGERLSTAINQTLPVLAGAGGQATYTAQRALQQVVMARLDRLHGARASADPQPERHVWLRPFSGLAKQSELDGVPGYRAIGAGLAAGIDQTFSSTLSLGGLLALSYNSITG